jgi:Holliday junction resolvasome RuvABC ATP-dependent DNA helicase subunit
MIISEKKIPIESTCATPLRDRFGIQARLEVYANSDH